jgi:hypothetical protein
MDLDLKPWRDNLFEVIPRWHYPYPRVGFLEFSTAPDGGVSGFRVFEQSFSRVGAQ